MNNNMQAYLTQLKETKLIDLVQSQSPSIINQVLQNYDREGEDVKSRKMIEMDREGSVALHRACARGLAEIVEILLVNGSEVNKTNDAGETPALLAAKRGNPIVLKILRDFGADMNVVDLKGQSLVHGAICNDNVYVLLWIESSTEIPLNSKDLAGHTPLHLCCINGKINSMKFLLRKSRSSIEERTSKGRETCLHLAILHHQLQCVPHILSKSSKKETMFPVTPLYEEDDSSILLSKNGNNKTPLDIFMDQPYEYKVSHRSFWYFFLIIQMTSLSQIKMNLNLYRVYLGTVPFLGFLLGIALSLTFPKLNVWIFILTSLLCCTYVRLQGHRICEIDPRSNPIFAGAYLAGIIHSILCFLVNVYPHMKGNEWEIILTVVSLLFFAVVYITLIFSDPGQLTRSQSSHDTFSDFIDHEIKKLKLNNLHSNTLPFDRFCTVCEVLPSVDNVKHCKICDMCIVDMDHHCLFLMTCISLKNLRKFLFLIILSMILMGLFIETSLKIITTTCGSLNGANPIEFVMCSYNRQPWISTVLSFNAVSCVWAAFMLRYQLSMISYNSTAYFHKNGKRSTMIQRLTRVLYFLVKGSFHHSHFESVYV